MNEIVLLSHITIYITICYTGLNKLRIYIIYNNNTNTNNSVL